MWLRRRLLSTAATAKRNSQLWGFHSQQQVTDLLCEQKIIINFMDKLQRNTSQDTAKEFGLDLKSLDTGLKLSYRRIAQVFEENVPGSFELKNSDLVSPELARQLDYQLDMFQKQGKVPRLNLQADEIQVNVVGLWLFPKYTREVLQSVSDGQYWEYYKMLPFYFRAQFYNLFLYLPGQRELVLAVEFTVKERFELVDKTAAVAPPRKYADDFIGTDAAAPVSAENKLEKAENVDNQPEVAGNVENKPENADNVEKVQIKPEVVGNQPEAAGKAENQPEQPAEQHKHYFVYVAQVDENQDSEEQDIDFVLHTMNEPFDFLLGM